MSEPLSTTVATLWRSLERVAEAYFETDGPGSAAETARPQTSQREDEAIPASGPDVTESAVSKRVSPRKIQTRSDVLEHLGMMPEEFVVAVLEEHEGAARQQAFTEYTAWSSSTVSRLLKEMEADGAIVRVQIGREKIVYLPHAAPARQSMDAAEGPPAKPA